MQNPDGIKTEKEKLHCSSRSEKTEAGCSFLLYEIAGSKANLPGIAGSKANLPGIAGSKTNLPEIARSKPNLPGIAGSKTNLPEITGSKTNLPGIAGEKASDFVNLKISRHDTRADPRCYPGRLRCDPRISRMFPGWHSRRLCHMVPLY